MRRNFLSTILGLAILSMAITACLGDEKTIEYSTDATIKSFSVDTTNNIRGTFTIDQINGKIFNQDSLRFGADTVVDRILLTITANGYLMTGDTSLIQTDSFDLSKTMESPMKVTAIALDGVTKKEYTIKVNIHKQDPDSLVWMKPGNPIGMNVSSEQKSICFNNELINYVSNTTAYTSTKGDSWTSKSISGMPADVQLSSITPFNGKVYAVTGSGKLIQSKDGVMWNETGLPYQFVTLVAAFPGTLSGIFLKGTERHFFTTDKDVTSIHEGELVAERFPTQNLSYDIYKTGTGLTKAIAIGDNVIATDTTSTPWISLDGLQWEEISTASSTLYLPALKQPKIIRYGSLFYAFGRGLNALYTSQEGLTWKVSKKKALFYKEMQGDTNFSTIIDRRMTTIQDADGHTKEKEGNFIWILRGTNDKKGDEVWRGRLNKLGFYQD